MPPKSSRHFSERIEASPNSILCRYLDEWYHQAAARHDKLQYVYRKALIALLNVPHQITNFKDFERLNGIGPRIRARLEKRYLEEFGSLPAAIPPDASSGARPQDASTKNVGRRKRAMAVQRKEYVPAFRSGPYAMLVALHLEGLRRDSRGFLLKNEIVAIGQPYCLAPMNEGTFSPVNGAIKTLCSKGLVSKTNSHPSRFSLTEDGAVLAERLWNSGERRSSAPLPDVPAARDAVAISLDDDSDDSGIALESTTSSSQALEWFSLQQGHFDIILMVDTREVKSREERSHIVEKLDAAGIKCEQRSLELGDFLWVARAKPGHEAMDEIVLDYVVERKREDDLVASIVDGRFLEQKFRLKNSGIAHRIYLVEKIDRLDFGNLGKERFEAAIVQTHALDGMFLRYTSGLEDTLKFLVSMTTTIVEKFQGSDLYSASAPFPVNKSAYMTGLQLLSQQQRTSFHQSFGCFSQINHKSANLTTQDIFLKQLLRIRGLTADKALHISKRFPSALSLWRHLRELPDEGSREAYFRDWRAADTQRRFGQVLSRRISRIFTANYSHDDTL